MRQGTQRRPLWAKITACAVALSLCFFPNVEGFLHHAHHRRVNVPSSQQQQAALSAPLLASTVVTWEVYVDQSKSALDKGASATLDAFLGLAPAGGHVKVFPAVISKTKCKPPAIRCISTQVGSSGSFDAGNIDSVDKVIRILNKHMKVKGVSMKTCECLKWKYKGNGYLEAGKVANAIDAYDKALAVMATKTTTTSSSVEAGNDQEGIILLMRANAYMQRASHHREKLKEIVNQLTGMVPDTETLQSLYKEGAKDPSLAKSIFRRVLTDSALQEAKFRQTQYRHGLYQYALLQAAQDSLRATQLLPAYADSWRRAGDILSELWKLKESAQYYGRAIELDNSLSKLLLPLIKRLRTRQELLDNARAYWSEETLRLALDVAR